MTPPTRRRMSGEQEALRLKAYAETGNDLAGARIVGVSGPAFRSWRVLRGLPSKHGPGRPCTSLTPQQKLVVDYVKANPWSGTHDIARGTGLHPIAANARLQTLEARGMLDICLVHRARRLAVHGTALPEGGMPFRVGAPSLYHAARLPVRIRELLEKEPFLPCSVIARQISPLATTKAVESQVLHMAMSGELQRKEIDTVRRRMNAYALPGARLTAARIRRAQAYVAESTTMGHSTAEAVEALRKHPWRTSVELQDLLKFTHTKIQSILRSLMDRKEIERVRVEEHTRAPVRYRYALAGTSVPAELVQAEGPSGLESSLARVALLVKDHSGASAPEILAAYRQRYPSRPIHRNTIQVRLKELVALGVVQTWTRGNKSFRYEANGQAQELVIATARRYWDEVEQARMKLRALGYAMSVQLRPPSWAPASEARDPTARTLVVHDAGCGRT